MRDEIRDAIENACESATGFGGRRRGVSFDTMRWRLRQFLREVPEDMSVQELRDELE